MRKVPVRILVRRMGSGLFNDILRRNQTKNKLFLTISLNMRKRTNFKEHYGETKEEIAKEI